jgi:hypothetical protein
VAAFDHFLYLVHVLDAEFPADNPPHDAPRVIAHVRLPGATPGQPGVLPLVALTRPDVTAAVRPLEPAAMGLAQSPFRSDRLSDADRARGGALGSVADGPAGFPGRNRAIASEVDWDAAVDPALWIAGADSLLVRYTGERAAAKGKKERHLRPSELFDQDASGASFAVLAAGAARRDEDVPLMHRLRAPRYPPTGAGRRAPAVPRAQDAHERARRRRARGACVRAVGAITPPRGCCGGLITFRASRHPSYLAPSIRTLSYTPGRTPASPASLARRASGTGAASNWADCTGYHRLGDIPQVASPVFRPPHTFEEVRELHDASPPRPHDAASRPRLRLSA